MASRTSSEPDLIILCGGRSSRMGEPKGLVAVGGKPWLRRQLDAAAEAGIARTVIVLGHGWELYRAAKPWGVSRTPAVEIVVNPEPHRGPFSSLMCGADVVSGDAFVLPVDVPCPRPEVWRALFEARQGAVRVAVPEHLDRGGHPILASREFLRALRAVRLDHPDARLDAQICGLEPREVARVAVSDERILHNMNRPEDWARLREAAAAPS